MCTPLISLDLPEEYKKGLAHNISYRSKPCLLPGATLILNKAMDDALPQLNLSLGKCQLKSFFICFF